MEKHFEDSPPVESIWLTIQDFEYLCFNLAIEQLTYNEPIPDYSTREQSLLESSLGSPRQTFGGKLLYPTLEKQASILFYSLIKNHPFENGNKRIAVMALLTFLSLNNKWLLIHPDDLYDIAIMVSKSQSEDKDKILDKLERILKEKVTNADF